MAMEKLRTDYLDLLLHQPFGDTFGAWRALEELYKEGKLRAIGISNHYADKEWLSLQILQRLSLW